MADRHERREWQRQRHRSATRSRPTRQTSTRRPADDCRSHIHVHSGGAGCTYSLNPTTRTVGAATTTGSVGGHRRHRLRVDRVELGRLADGHGRRKRSGNGTVNYSVAANTASTARSATLTVGTATFTLTQSGSCTYSVSPTSHSFNPAGGTASVTVTAAADARGPPHAQDPGSRLPAAPAGRATAPSATGFRPMAARRLGPER